MGDILGERPTEATYLTDSSFEVQTADNEDHTFHGVMFDLRSKTDLPVHNMLVEEIWVRGCLGDPVTVWYTNGPFDPVKTTPSRWTNVFRSKMEPSYRKLACLKLETPIVIPAGKTVGVYVHAVSESDDGIVYDNRRHDVVHEDRFVVVEAGMAHMDVRPFGNMNPWGMGRGAFRANRTFVGQLKIGVKYMLWNPEVHNQFPPQFKLMVKTLLLCARRPECWLHFVSNEVLLWLINMCSWEWPADPRGGMDEVRGPRRANPAQMRRYGGYNIRHEPTDLFAEEQRKHERERAQPREREYRPAAMVHYAYMWDNEPDEDD